MFRMIFSGRSPNAALRPFVCVASVRIALTSDESNFARRVPELGADAAECVPFSVALSGSDLGMQEDLGRVGS